MIGSKLPWNIGQRHLAGLRSAAPIVTFVGQTVEAHYGCDGFLESTEFLCQRKTKDAGAAWDVVPGEQLSLEGVRQERGVDGTRGSTLACAKMNPTHVGH